MFKNKFKTTGAEFWNISMKLIIANVVLFLLTSLFQGLSNSYLVLHSANVLSQPWTLFTTMFLHAGVGHLFFNMYALLIFGPLVEKRIGSLRFIIFYVIAGIIASLSFVLFSPTGSAVGASGAIMGVIGLVIMLFPDLRVLFFFVIPMSMRTAGIIFFLIDFIGLFNASSGVANIAHIAGLFCGLAFGYYLIKQKKQFYNKFTSKTKPRTTTYHSKNGSRVHASTNPKDVVIELSDEDVDEYLKHGRV